MCILILYKFFFNSLAQSLDYALKLLMIGLKTFMSVEMMLHLCKICKHRGYPSVGHGNEHGILSVKLSAVRTMNKGGKNIVYLILIIGIGKYPGAANDRGADAGIKFAR